MAIQSNFDGDWKDACPFCGESHESHKIDYGEGPDGNIYWHRMPCEPEKAKIIKRRKREVLTFRGILFVGWICIPLAIVILGFASFWIGLILFVISLLKIGLEFVRLFGDADKWIPGHKGRIEKRRKMEHYYYHCERNPEGFRHLLRDNLSAED